MSEGMKRARAVACSVAAGMLLAACSESITNPDTPGSGLIGRDVIVRDTVLNVINDTTFLQRIAPDGIFLSPLRQNLVGKSDNYTAHTAIRFNVALARDTINVLSARMILRLVTWQGDSAGTFAFNVHKINSAWTESQLTWRQADSTGFYDASVVGSYSASIGPDTQYISVNLDTAMVREWFRSNTTTNNGMLLVPAGSSSIIRGIHAFVYDSAHFQPKLEVIARGTSTTLNDTTSIQVGIDTYVADVNPAPLDPQRIFTQAGIAYRSRLNFDVSHLPRGAVVNSAELLLHRDPTRTTVNKFTPSPQPIVHALLSNDSTDMDVISSAGSLKTGTANTFSFDVRRQVQLWENGINYGLILRQPTLNEFSTLDIYTFYSSETTDPALRPRILVKYSVFQN